MLLLTLSIEHEVLERDAQELHADKRLPQAEWFKLDQDDREELFGFLGNRSVPLTKLQTQGMVGEDMKDKVQDGVESKALKMAEERARIAEERVKSLEAKVQGSVGPKTLKMAEERARAAEERVESLKSTRKNRKTRLKEEVAREMRAYDTGDLQGLLTYLYFLELDLAAEEHSGFRKH